MFQTIEKDIIAAMKSKDKFKLSVLRMLKSALKNEEINKKETLSEEEVLAVVKKQVKVRRDSLVDFEKYGETSKCDDLNSEIDILLNYMPKELTDEEIVSEVEKLFEVVKPTGPKDMGACMKYASLNIKNADMSKVSALIKEKLN